MVRLASIAAPSSWVVVPCCCVRFVRGEVGKITLNPDQVKVWIRELRAGDDPQRYDPRLRAIAQRLLLSGETPRKAAKRKAPKERDEQQYYANGRLRPPIVKLAYLGKMGNIIETHPDREEGIMEAFYQMDPHQGGIEAGYGFLAAKIVEGGKWNPLDDLDFDRPSIGMVNNVKSDN